MSVYVKTRVLKGDERPGPGRWKQIVCYACHYRDTVGSRESARTRLQHVRSSVHKHRLRELNRRKRKETTTR